MANEPVHKGRLLYYEPNNNTQFAGHGWLTESNVKGTEKYFEKSHNNRIYALEEYNEYVDLEVVIPKREEGSYIGPSNEKETRISLLNSNGDLTDSFVHASYSSIKGSKLSNRENLGIENININLDSHMYPQVNIKFTDVRAFSLMQPAMMAKKDDNYTAFFNSIFKFPYPRFILTIKGYYGPPATFDLAVDEFTSALNPSTGNFDVDITFIGYPFGLLSDIPLNMAILAPYFDSDDTGKIEGYWEEAKNDRFLYADKKGKEEINDAPMMTYLEYIKATNDINKKLKDTQGSEVLGELNEAKGEKEKLEKI